MHEKIKELNINGLTISDFGGRGMSQIEGNFINLEIGKKDPCVATFFTVHTGLGMFSVDKLSN